MWSTHITIYLHLIFPRMAKAKAWGSCEQIRSRLANMKRSTVWVEESFFSGLIRSQFSPRSTWSLWFAFPQWPRHFNDSDDSKGNATKTKIIAITIHGSVILTSIQVCSTWAKQAVRKWHRFTSELCFFQLKVPRKNVLNHYKNAILAIFIWLINAISHSLQI